MKEIIKGKLIIIGGAEDKEGNKEILKIVRDSIDKNTDELVIATIATTNPKEAGDKYNELFSNLGVKNISILDVQSREEAHREEKISLVKNAKLIFFTGGDQLRITSIVGGTPLHKELKDAYSKGCIFAGTSAGASVMSSTMVVNGDDEESPKKCTLKMAPGLGLIDRVIIDQHFAQRGRIGRLLGGVAENPDVLGIGIDEDTAIIVDNDGKFTIMGSGAVYVIDGSCISYSNVSEQNQDEVLSMFNVKMHILKEGNNFNLLTRKPLEEERLNNENN